jgi:putative transposase
VLFSRYVVGWMVAHRETAELAEQLIADTLEKENIAPDTLTLHADRGTSMRSKPVAALLVDLDVAKTHSRPHVSNDNPYSESHFKTLKYPAAVHDGTAVALTARRSLTLDAAFAAHPNRFKGIAPKPPVVPAAAWINPPKKESAPTALHPVAR